MKIGEFEEYNKTLLKSVLFVVISPSEWFCKKIKKAVKQLKDNYNYNDLNRIVVNRAEIDMDIIRDYYSMDNKSDLIKDIQEISEEFYREVLIALCMK